MKYGKFNITYTVGVLSESTELYKVLLYIN